MNIGLRLEWFQWKELMDILESYLESVHDESYIEDIEGIYDSLDRQLTIEHDKQKGKP